jgi:hypothetical protein
MKILQWFFSMACVGALGCAAQAATYSFSGPLSHGSTIPDGDANGWTDTLTVSVGATGGNNPPLVAGDYIVANTLTVTLNISGGYNSDLFGYLTHEGGYAVLLNRVGVNGVAGVSIPGSPNNRDGELGSAGAGFNVQFVAESLSPVIPDIHTYEIAAGQTVGGTGTPVTAGVDGRDVSSLNGQSFSGVSRTALLSSFNNQAATGDWTLYFTDLFSGDTSTVNGWSIAFEAVPEPVHVALGIFGALFGVVQAGRYLRRRTEKRA